MNSKQQQLKKAERAWYEAKAHAEQAADRVSDCEKKVARLREELNCARSGAVLSAQSANGGNMRAMILDSIDGQEYARVVLLPESMDILKAEEIAEAAINKAVKANPEEHTWDEIAAELEQVGFIIPHTFNGPTWDSSCL